MKAEATLEEDRKLRKEHKIIDRQVGFNPLLMKSKAANPLLMYSAAAISLVMKSTAANPFLMKSEPAIRKSRKESIFKNRKVGFNPLLRQTSETVVEEDRIRKSSRQEKLQDGPKVMSTPPAKSTRSHDKIEPKLKY